MLKLSVVPVLKSFYYLSTNKSLIGVALLASTFLAAGCSSLNLPPPGTLTCKIRTYIDAGVLDYLSGEYDSKSAIRVGIMPFNTPVSFSSSGQDFGRELALKLQQSLLETGDFAIVEFLDVAKWEGKKEEFYAGNYQALRLARNAGFDLLIVGVMEPIVNESDLVVNTKVLDAGGNVTIWYGQTTVSLNNRSLRRRISSIGLSKDRPDLFYFPERTDEFVRCTTDGIIGRIFDTEENSW